VDSRDSYPFKDRVSQNISVVKRWVKMWSFLHHSFLFGAAVLSTSAAVILQLKANGNDALQRDIASVLSAVAALAGVIAASGAFERKWRTCRSTRSRLIKLEIDLTPENMDSKEIKERYNAIWDDHETGIVGAAK
jgi:hypothetical protein